MVACGSYCDYWLVLGPLCWAQSKPAGGLTSHNGFHWIQTTSGQPTVTAGGRRIDQNRCDIRIKTAGIVVKTQNESIHHVGSIFLRFRMTCSVHRILFVFIIQLEKNKWWLILMDKIIEYLNYINEYKFGWLALILIHMPKKLKFIHSINLNECNHHQHLSFSSSSFRMIWSNVDWDSSFQIRWI